jgi:hypothetical protein
MGDLPPMAHGQRRQDQQQPERRIEEETAGIFHRAG